MKCAFFLGCIAIVVGTGATLCSAGSAAKPEQAAVETVLNRYHESAAKADGAAYFSLFAPECILLGTDATERWTIEQFKGYALPHFSKGRGWTYVVKQRHITFPPQGDFAWFDEILDNKSYGTCRGTGVLRKAGDTWLICQYQLTIPVPNELATRVVQLIRHSPEPAPLPPK